MKSYRVALLLATALSALPIMARAETKEYNLTIGTQPVSVDGHTVKKITINGTLPGPVLHFTEGDDAVINVTNTLKEDTSIHWHGLLVPGEQDGVPGFNGFDGIRPGQTFTYRFHIKQSGTYWYHAHSMGQEQDGLFSGLVIDPAPGTPDAAETAPADKEYVLILSDESAESANQIQAHLKGNADYYQYHRRTVGDFFHDVKTMGFGKATEMAGMWGKMNMRPTDLADVEGYTFDINGMSPKQNWTGLFKPGEKVKLRIVNAGAMTMFDVRIPGLKMTVVAADGQPIEPVTVDEFRIGNAETYDVIVKPTEDKAYTIAAESIDRTGFALGTLAPREGMRGDIPAERPRSVLTMSDMNMNQMMKDDPKMDMAMMDVPSGWADAHAPEGTKILSYSDLKYAGTQTDTRAPTRDIQVVLDGNMERYVWTINGKTFDPAVGIHLAYNERVRLTYVNNSMMAHPMHLHGMFVQLDNGQSDDKLPNKHTVIVPPGQTVSVLLTADNEGTWAFHCHLMNHMLSGMMTDLVVEKPGAPPPSEAADQPKASSGMSGMDMSNTGKGGQMAGTKSGMDMSPAKPADKKSDQGSMQGMDMSASSPGMTMSAPQAAGPSNGPKATGATDDNSMAGMAMGGGQTSAPSKSDQSSMSGMSGMSGMNMGAMKMDDAKSAKKAPVTAHGKAKAAKPKVKAKKKLAPAKSTKKPATAMPGMDMSGMNMGQMKKGKDQSHAQ